MPVVSFAKQRNGILVHLRPGCLTLTVWDSDILRIRYSPADAMPVKQERTVPGSPHAVRWAVRDEEKAIYLSTDRLTARVNKQTGAISFLDVARHAILRELPTGGRTMTPVTVKAKQTYETVQVFTSPPGEKLYAVAKYSRRSEHTDVNRTRPTPPNPLLDASLIISNMGYGLFWNNVSVTNFDTAETPSVGKDAPRHEPYHRKTFRSAIGNDIDYFFLYGPELDRVLAEYDTVSNITGETRLE